MPPQTSRWHEAAHLKGGILYTLREVQVIIERWRREYNIFRPHSSLSFRPPAPESIHMADEFVTVEQLIELTTALALTVMRGSGVREAAQ